MFGDTNVSDVTSALLEAENGRLPPRFLAGRGRLDRQRMDCGLELRRKQLVHRPVAVDAAHPCEGGRDDTHPEMRLAGAVERLVMTRFGMVIVSFASIVDLMDIVPRAHQIWVSRRWRLGSAP
jgi:hypothetical protein